MKNYDFIPHAANMRSSSQVLHLIEAEGAAGYGFYWVLLEYLREQPLYTGDVRAIKNIARQMKVRLDKAMRILNNYGLFILEDTRFRSPYLDEKLRNMKPKRSKSCPQNEETVSKVSCNTLKINDASFKNKNIEEEKEEDTSSPISSPTATEGEEVKAEVAEVVAEEALPVSFVPAWERYVDELREDEQWKELVAMRSGLKEKFYELFPRIVEAFKRHVRSIGNEGQILSPGDAKHYFWFFMSPSSPTYKNLILELQKPLDKGEYKHEDYDPATGQRSYCGVPIPADAPPRPNGQAVWCDGKWVF